MKGLTPEEQERRLDEQLAALARADAGAEAPPRVAAALGAALARVRARRRRWPWLAGAAAAAAAGLALWVGTRPAPPEARPRPLAGAVPPAMAPLAVSASAGPFLPIGAVERAHELEHGRIVRMQVPAGLAVSFGWPLPPEDDRPRTADVLFGEDGVARAIRFVPTSFRAGR
jgi:hypothetical protein